MATSELCPSDLPMNLAFLTGGLFPKVLQRTEVNRMNVTGGLAQRA